MQREVSIYEINCNYKNNEMCFENKTKIGTLNFNYDYNYNDIEDKILSYKDIYDEMELDQCYYMVEENPWKIVGVISLRKGYTFIDCAEHDDRVIIKTAFPNQKCNIMGE